MQLSFILLVPVLVLFGTSHGASKVEFLENRVQCLDKDFRYRKRPQDLMTVSLHVAILSVDQLSSERMELSTHLYLLHKWGDRRCQFRPLPGQQKLTLYSRPGEGSAWSHPGLDNLWQPDTHVLNAKRLHRPETVTHIRTIGMVESRTRISLTASCPMNLRLFPLDRQVCSIVFQSSAHPDSELTYRWMNDSYLPFVQGLDYQDQMTPDLRLLGYRLRKTNSTPDELTGNIYVQMVVDLFLERPLGYFIWEVYMPATFIVAMSFTSFWLDRAATPARVSLGVTTVLTITTLLSSANTNLPPTAYPKAIGVFLAGCFMFTFLALMEYSVASYLEKRRSIRNQIKSLLKQDEEDNHIKQRRFTLAVPRDPLGLRPAAVDVYSRVVFPVTFLIFQICYWVTCVLNQIPMPSDVILLVRK